MAIKHILVTGSSGTIGTRLCEELLQKGFRVTGVDWKKNKWNAAVDKATITLDLRDRSAVLEKLPADVDSIVHLAANARVYNLVRDPVLARDNFETVFNVLEFARARQIPRFVFASSREVYGNAKKDLHTEDGMQVEHCESTYTVSKIAGEAAVHAYHNCYDIDFLIYRFSNVYGMYDDSDRVIPLFIRLAGAGKDLVVYGKDKLLDFTYISDTVKGIMLGLERFDEVKNRTFNISTGKGVAIRKVAEMITAKMHSASRIAIEENRTGEVVHYVADISRAKKLLGYHPQVAIEDGIERSVAWYRAHNLV